MAGFVVGVFSLAGGHMGSRYMVLLSLLGKYLDRTHGTRFFQVGILEGAFGGVL